MIGRLSPWELSLAIVEQLTISEEQQLSVYCYIVAATTQGAAAVPIMNKHGHNFVLTIRVKPGRCYVFDSFHNLVRTYNLNCMLFGSVVFEYNHFKKTLLNGDHSDE